MATLYYPNSELGTYTWELPESEADGANPYAGSITLEQPAALDTFSSLTNDASLLTQTERAETPVPNWMRRNKIKLLAGATAVSAAATVVMNPLGETMETVARELPAVGGSMLALEAAWIGGAAMMLSSVGQTTKNPLKVRQHMSAIAQRANDSKLFQTGFWVNSAAAVGQFVVPAVAVVAKMPPESWGLLALPVADLAVTIQVRRAIRQGIKNNLPASEE